MGSMAGCGLNGRYVGMAPEADIMGAHLPLGHFTDKFLKRISEYILSHREDYPFINDEINNTTLYEEVFNQLVGPGHIVVASAGNNGHQKTYLKKETGTALEQDVYYRRYPLPA